ncbi:MAG: hypothetical protein O6950_03080 [Gammaproteobacteria bacterium]|nr:hypothetical protein [Gammaproteobacteria bacterium]
MIGTTASKDCAPIGRARECRRFAQTVWNRPVMHARAGGAAAEFWVMTSPALCNTGMRAPYVSAPDAPVRILCTRPRVYGILRAPGIETHIVQASGLTGFYGAILIGWEKS